MRLKLFNLNFQNWQLRRGPEITPTQNPGENGMWCEIRPSACQKNINNGITNKRFLSKSSKSLAERRLDCQ